jgi:hypothetical protein
MKRIFLCAWLLGAISYQSTAQQKVSVVNHYVSEDAISDKGTVSQKIEMKSDITPLVKLLNIRTEQVDQVPANVQISNSFEPDVTRLTERKKQFAFVSIPAYRRNGATLERLISYDLEVTEYEDETGGQVAQKPTTVTTSVLASGTWYKIAAPVRGIYKIDYAFLQNIGVNPANINPANIRVYGNGGTVMQEKVSDDQPDDLIENAVFVSGSGSSFGSGDYVLFYANGPIRWDKDSLNQSFTHTPNYYEDQSYYFLNFDLGAGKRISSEAATGTSSYTVTGFDDYALIEHDSFNLGNMGKTWWGDKMNSINAATLTKTFPVSLGNVIDNVKLTTIVGSVNDASSTIAMSYPNNGATGNFYFTLSPSIGTNYFITPQSKDVTFKPGSPNFNITYQYSTGGTGAGYIDYLRFNYRRQPVFPGGQLVFRDWNTASLPAGQNASYTLQNANANVKVWDITDPLSPVALNGTSGGSTFTFVRPGHRLHEFVAYDDATQFNKPVSVGPVANQDLHGLGEIDLLIITPPEFKAAADEVAAFHVQNEGISVAVAQTNQVYNEFSSGGQDIAGIRNFIKMFYDRAAPDQHDMIKNVLFMGAASYDYKTRIGFNTNFVPTFQTIQSANSELAYSTDDFFALLDNGENLDCNGCTPAVDIGTGRIPAFTKEEANGFVAKIKHYVGPESFGPWKNIVSYVADDRDENHGMNHMADCETVSSFYLDSAKVMNVYKIYSDAYNKIATPSGARYPSVNKAIDDQIYNGTFLMSYSGHGSPTRWSHEAILTADDYGNWKNKDKLPVMVTATCDFGRFDDPENRSAGARLMINPNSGSIAMITTTQIVLQYQNTLLNEAYTAAQFSRDNNGKWKTIGESLKEAKNRYPSDNNYKYVVLGDPALKMAMPVHTVATDKLEFLDNGTSTKTDTIKALGRYMLSGSVKDKNGNVVNDFNGPVYVTIFDKTRKIQVVNPEQDETPNFNLQTSIVAKVKGTAKNGQFTATFVAPKDINYEYGFGKISYYANTATVDASGLDTTFTVGDYNHSAAADNDAPIVKPYIDNEKFRNGGVTGPNPLLYVKLYDENGINVSGNSIGHDLVAILDEDLQNPYVMNNYYETEQNDYRKGYVNFPMYNLPDGVHTLRVKAWDAYNNSGEGVVTFEVKNKDKGFISDLYTYPNPVTDITHIVFQHNQENEAMDVTVQIYNAAGALARTLTESMTTTGNRTEIMWDGLGQNGAPLQRGVYFYRLTARTSKGISATAYQKLVLMR